MYKPAVLFSYKQSKSKLPIDTWMEIVGKKLPTFQTNDDIYAPIPITLKIAGNVNTPDGSVKLSVSATDKNWYDDLVQVVSGMVNKNSVEIVNMLGMPIKDMSTKELFNVGECDVIDLKTKNVVRLPKIVEPPVKMSTNKIATLKKWWLDNAENLSKKVAMQFKNLNMAEIDKACVANGPVQKEIESYISQNTIGDMSWGSFLENFSNNRTNLQDISKKVLDAIRTALRANEETIKNFHAFTGVASSVWSKNTTEAKSPYRDEFSMYRDVVEDAVFHPLVGQAVLQGILYGTKQKQLSNINSEIIQAEFHPLQSYYQKHHYHVHGKLPGHLIAAYNNNQGKFENNYPADPHETIAMYNLFCGKAIHPERIEGIIFNRKKKNTKGKCKNMKKTLFGTYKCVDNKIQTPKHELPELIPIGSEMVGKRMPELIPIGLEILPKLIPIDGKRMPKLSGEFLGIEVASDRELSEPLWKTELPSIADLLKQRK